jgi:Mn-dependent DtxR family transcriptional regulator
LQERLSQSEAAELLNVSPRLVAAVNRHLNESQRAVIAARLETLKHGQRADRARDANLHVLKREDAAELLNVSPRLVATVKA